MECKTYKGDRISRLGFGCMRFPLVPGEEFKIDEKEAEALLVRAYEAGVNYFDTAFPYHGKTSEEFVGRVLSRYPRSSYKLATKMPLGMLKDLEGAKEVFKKQQENLRTDYFDFYLLHGINLEKWFFAKETGIYDYLKEMKACGVIKNLGFSFHGYAKDIAAILDDGDFDFVQIQMNYVDWEMQNAELEYEIIRAHGLPVMVMEPCKGGALATLNPEASSVLKGLDPEASLASWAFRWVASHDSILVTLSGMSDRNQVEDNLKTFSSRLELSEEENNAILEAKRLFLRSRTIPCTKCRYCMPCTRGLVIPEIIAIHNRYVIDHDKEAMKASYDSMAAKGSDCVNCRKCMAQCPQGINIVEHMKQIDRTIRSL